MARAGSRYLSLIIGIMFALTVTAGIGDVAAASFQRGAGATYYVDSQAGDDNNDGLSEQTAWRSHTMIATVQLQPGDTVAFKRGSSFSGPLHIKASGTEQQPITITSFGEGELPRFTNPKDSDMNGNAIRLSGSWIILEKLHFHDTPPARFAGRPQSIFKMGAVFNMPGADHNIIRDNVFTNCTKAIQSTGEYTLITRNVMDGPNHALWIQENASDAWGPIGIHLGIGNQEISYNTIRNYLTTDSPYGSDGGAIEMDDGRYHKDNVTIHHNYTEGNAGFLEASWEYDYLPFVQEVNNLRVAFNVSVDGQDWLYLWAPCNDCFFDNNTVIRTRDFTSPLDDVVVLDFEGIHFRNNLFVHKTDVYRGQGATAIVTEGNWYFLVGDSAMAHGDPNPAGSGDPELVDLDGGDFHLTCDSPLIGRGVNLSADHALDFEDRPLPQAGAWDIGALQAQGCSE